LIHDLKSLEGSPQPPEFHAEGDAAKHTRLAVEACPEDCDPDLLKVDGNHICFQTGSFAATFDCLFVPIELYPEK